MKLKSLFKPIPEQYRFDNFCYPSLTDSHSKQNSQQSWQINWLRKINQQKSSLTLIIGGIGSGKTHLLKALVTQAIEQKKNSLYLSFKDEAIKQINELGSDLDLLCLDSLEKIKSRESQISIYQLINQNNLNLVIATQIEPNQLSMIADLKTRLISGKVIKVLALNESEQIEAIKIKIKEKGIQLSKRVFEQFFLKSDRNMHQLNQNLNELIDYAGSKKISLTLLNQFFNAKINHQKINKND